MRNFIGLIIFLCVSAVFSSPGNTKELQFISGLLLLDSKAEMTDSLRAVKFLELQKITGISGRDAIYFIEKYRDKPEDWKKISDSINKMMNRADSHSK
jgi:hypothetical protein